MRNADTLIRLLKSKGTEKQFDFWCQKLNDKEEQLFLGVRDGRIDIYYLGCRIAELKENNGKIEYSIDEYYSDGCGTVLDFDEYSRLYPIIKQRAWEYAMGERKDGKNNRKHREKVCQQWIANQYNFNSDEWYFTDIEYIDTTNKKDQNAARMDMIAVSRKKIDGKHRVALVELKVTDSAFGGFKGYERICKEEYDKIIDDPEINIIVKPRKYKGELRYYKIKDVYHKLKEDLYQKRYWTTKYGSGIVSHFVDFSRYLYEPQNYKYTLKKEIINTLAVHKQFNLLDAQDCLRNISESDLCDKPNIYIISYTKSPTMYNDVNGACEIKQLKKRMYNELFQSPYCLERMLNKDQISGILKNKALIKAMQNDSDNNWIDLTHEVRNEPYVISLVFVDACSAETSWECMKK